MSTRELILFINRDQYPNNKEKETLSLQYLLNKNKPINGNHNKNVKSLFIWFSTYYRNQMYPFFI